ncbi:hypothetical protein [Aestuariibius sp. HNIBRBA575]|uniref:hypothetical protein n=1 Tax=Aestuariibius sp. HNIBRBA575 TaxID=3233343 RepID=UPI0034A20089
MTETRAVLDEMIDFAKIELTSGNADRKRAMVRRMAEQWPSEPALSLVYAVTSATGAIEDESKKDPAISQGYRLSALISADVHAVQSMGQNPSFAGDLLHFWRRVDPLFLRMQ